MNPATVEELRRLSARAAERASLFRLAGDSPDATHWRAAAQALSEAARHIETGINVAPRS